MGKFGKLPLNCYVFKCHLWGLPSIHRLLPLFPHFRHLSFGDRSLITAFGNLASSQSRLIHPSRSHRQHRPPINAHPDKVSNLWAISYRSAISFGRSVYSGSVFRVRSIPFRWRIVLVLFLYEGRVKVIKAQSDVSRTCANVKLSASSTVRISDRSRSAIKLRVRSPSMPSNRLSASASCSGYP